MILAIFGYPKTGKTILFNLLTGQKEQISKFSVSTEELHKAVVNVPDDRLTRLAEFHQAPAIHAKIEFLDTGAVSFGEARESTFMDLLRRADGLVHLVRGFADAEILHPQGEIDPERDMRIIEEELKTTDFLSLDKRIERLSLDIRKMKTKELEEEMDLLKRLRDFVEGGRPLREYPLTAKEDTLVRGFKFISQKPLLHLINCDEASWKKYRSLAHAPTDKKATAVFAGKIETELLELDETDRAVFQSEYGLADYTFIRDQFIRTSYELLNLISFFTVGKDENKAWTVERGINAFLAAGKIHSDIQRGFIRAEVIPWQDFLAAGGFAHAKEKGTLRLEGKEYIIQDGEIVHFRFNA